MDKDVFGEMAKNGPVQLLPDQKSANSLVDCFLLAG